MRSAALLIAALLALPCLCGGSTGSQYIFYLGSKFEEPVQTVNYTGADQNLTLYGEVWLDKTQKGVMVVTLSCAVDSGWNSTVSPDIMVFHIPSIQAFTCTVVVPGGATGTGNLTLTAAVPSQLLTNTSNATIIVSGGPPPPANRTLNSTGGQTPPEGANTTSGSLDGGGNVGAGWLGALSNNIFPFSISILLLTVAAVAAAVRLARSRRRRAAEADDVRNA